MPMRPADRPRLIARSATCARVLALSACDGRAAHFGCGVGASPARGAEAGLNISSPEPSQVAGVEEAGGPLGADVPHLAEHAADPRGDRTRSNWIAQYEQAFNALPAGTKVILDVVEHPAWETGSADAHAPPANPEDYAGVRRGARPRLAGWGRVAAYEIWNEEDSAGWWTAGPNPAAYTQPAAGDLPGGQGGRPAATGRWRADGQRLRVPGRRLSGRGQGLLRCGRRSHRHRLQHPLALRLPARTTTG